MTEHSQTHPSSTPEAPPKERINVICIKWGVGYPANYVNNLKSMVKRNTTYEIDFYCFTDDFNGLDGDVITKPIPEIKVTPSGCFKRETAFFSPNLGGLKGQRVFYFDLDVIMINNLDSLFAYPPNDEFYIINDWASDGDRVGQGSCFSWVISDRYNDITTYYEDNKSAVDLKYGTASQEYLSDKIIEKQARLNFWPEEWFCSFRFHCLPSPLLRHFKAPRFPEKKDLKVVVFHGYPNPQEALEGRWPDKRKHHWKIWKKLYKHVQPTLWIKDYWH
jgi:hypothetical protein